MKSGLIILVLIGLMSLTFVPAANAIVLPQYEWPETCGNPTCPMHGSPPYVGDDDDNIRIYFAEAWINRK